MSVFLRSTRVNFSLQNAASWTVEYPEFSLVIFGCCCSSCTLLHTRSLVSWWCKGSSSQFKHVFTVVLLWKLLCRSWWGDCGVQQEITKDSGANQVFASSCLFLKSFAIKLGVVAESERVIQPQVLNPKTMQCLRQAVWTPSARILETHW